MKPGNPWSSYTALGDSITEGYGDRAGGIDARSWTDWLADGLRAFQPDLTYRNIGLRDTTTDDVLRDQLPEVRRTRPELVSVTVGANDARRDEWSADRFTAEFGRLLNGITAAGADLITFTYPDIRPAIHETGRPIPKPWEIYFERLHATNAVIRALSREYAACLLDFEDSEPALEPEHLSSDLTHPNAVGYRLAGIRALEILTARSDLRTSVSAC